jgi:hypothetical protein
LTKSEILDVPGRFACLEDRQRRLRGRKAESGDIHALHATNATLKEFNMRSIAIVVCLALACVGAPAFAHPHGEDEYVEPRQPAVSALAQQSIERLVREDKLSSSWTSARLMGQELRVKDGRMQWVVIYQNPAERRRSRRMLYVLMSTTGSFISADHTLT